MDLKQHLLRQMAFSHATFGPGRRAHGVIDHIRKELAEVEVEANAGSGRDRLAEEWADVVILALDGLTRALSYNYADKRCAYPEHEAERACAILLKAQARNEARDWPDWRTAEKDKAIEHVKGDEE